MDVAARSLSACAKVLHRCNRGGVHIDGYLARRGDVHVDAVAAKDAGIASYRVCKVPVGRRSCRHR